MVVDVFEVVVGRSLIVLGSTIIKSLLRPSKKNKDVPRPDFYKRKRWAGGFFFFIIYYFLLHAFFTHYYLPPGTRWSSKVKY